ASCGGDCACSFDLREERMIERAHSVSREGLSHETDMQYCAGAGAVDPADRVKGRFRLRRYRSNCVRQDCPRLPKKSYWVRQDDARVGARVYEWREHGLPSEWSV